MHPWGPSHDLEEADSISSVQPHTDPISLRATEAEWACDLTLASDTSGEVCRGGKVSSFWLFPLAGLVAGSGRHGKNPGPADVLKILIASSLPLHAAGLLAT